MRLSTSVLVRFFLQAKDGIRDKLVTGVQTCALPIFNELAKFFRPQRAVQAEPQHFARVALRQLPALCRATGVRTCPDGPQEGPGQREHAGHLGVNIGLRPLSLGKGLEIRPVLPPKRVAGGPLRTEQLEQPYAAEFGILHGESGKVLRDRSRVDVRDGLPTGDFRGAEHGPMELVADPGSRGFDQLRARLEMLVGCTAIDPGTLRHPGDAQAFLTPERQYLARGLQDRFAGPSRVTLFADLPW